MNKEKQMFRKIKWYLKQLLPLTYRSHYKRAGKDYFCVWKMWFGRCYKMEEYQIIKGY